LPPERIARSSRFPDVPRVCWFTNAMMAANDGVPPDVPRRR